MRYQKIIALHLGLYFPQEYSIINAGAAQSKKRLTPATWPVEKS